MKTIKAIIDYVDSVKPNQYTKEQKIEWLSEIDYQIFNEINIDSRARGRRVVCRI